MLKVNTCVYVHPYDSFNAKKDIIETNIASLVIVHLSI